MSEENEQKIADRQEIIRQRIALGLAASPDSVRGDMAAVNRWRNLYLKLKKEKDGYD